MIVMAQDDPPAVLLCKPQTVVHHYRGYPLRVCVLKGNMYTHCICLSRKSTPIVFLYLRVNTPLQ